MLPIYADDEMIRQIKFSGQMPSLRQAIATRHLIVDQSTRMGIEVSPSDLQSAADHFRACNQLTDAQTTWQWLEHQGLSLEEFESMISYSMLQKRLMEALCADHVEPYFIEHQHEYSQAAIYEIPFDDEAIAWDNYYAIQAGEINFFEVAQSYIQAVELRRQGGYRGYVRRPDLPPAIAAAIFGASPPQLLKPRTTATGVYLILLEEIVEPILNEDLRSEILLSLFSQWIQKELEI